MNNTRLFKRKILSKIAHIIPDKLYLKIRYYTFFHKKLDLKNPKRFTEKIQYLKLFDRKSHYTDLADKAVVKKIVAQLIGEQYIIPSLGVWDKFDDIDFNSLPDKFVLKCTHDSGSIYICTDKKQFNYVQVKKEIESKLKDNYYWFGREWVYKNIKPRIIAEQYMVDESGTELKDYKFFCFNGVPKMIEVDYNRFSNHSRNLYTPAWDLINAKIQYSSDSSVVIPKPNCLEKMLELASKLSEGYPHLRIDFYVINDQIFFGEITFYHGSGFEHFYPDSLDYEIGNWLDIGMVKK